MPAGGRGLVPLDLSVRLPEGTYGRIAPRSGLAWKKGVMVGAGVIDRDYEGNVSVLLFNHGTEDLCVSVGDRIAQLIIECNMTPDICVLGREAHAVHTPEVTTHTPSNHKRGTGGFGSTGDGVSRVQRDGTFTGSPDIFEMTNLSI